MKVSVIGTGYVGLVAAAAFAEHGNDVVCADIDAAKIEALRAGDVPIYEPGLAPLVQRNAAAGRLRFTTSNAEAAEHAEVLFLAVGTPTEGADGSPNLSYLFAAATQIAPHLRRFTVIVDKSTVPVGTAERVARLIADHATVPFVVASNPEFLKEGAAVADFMQPDRVVIGTTDARARELLHRLYQPFLRTSDRVLFMDARSAELTKYACNAYLAARISFINDIANLCDAVGADVEQVRRGMGSDIRIGNRFLFPGVGYGGSCFPKDTRALLSTGREHGLSLSIVAAADTINEAQKLVLVRKVRTYFGDAVAGREVAGPGPRARARTGRRWRAASRPRPRSDGQLHGGTGRRGGAGAQLRRPLRSRRRGGRSGSLHGVAAVPLTRLRAPARQHAHARALRRPQPVGSRACRRPRVSLRGDRSLRPTRSAHSSTHSLPGSSWNSNSTTRGGPSQRG
jgi:UDPglucose 6-dehydrogenase